MSITTFTPQILREGTRAVPEIPVGLTPPFMNTYSMDFDGIDEYVDCGVISDFVNSSAFSISGWFYFNSVTNETLFSYGGATGTQYCFTVQTFAGGNLIFVIANATNDAGNNYIQTNLSSVLTTSAWYHIACTYDGSQPGNTDKAKIYVNGAEATYGGGGGTIPSITTTSTGTFNIGRWDLGGSDRNLNGNIDEVAIFNSVIPIGDLWDGSGQPTDLSLLATPPTNWFRMGDNGSYKSPQWLIPNNENKDKVSNYTFEFDGVDDYIDIGSSSTVANGGQFTFSFWIKGSTQALGAKNLLSADYYNLHTFWTAQNSSLYWRNINNVYKLLSSNVLDGDWHHILIVYNPDDADETIRCFTDGANEVNVVTDFRYKRVGGSYDGPLRYIGNRGGGTFPGFNGSIDEFAVWNDDQSANLSTIYNGGVPNDLTSLSPIDWYRTGEEATFSGGVWTVPDQVGSNDGTSNAMTIEDRVGDAPSSSNNAVSFNMDFEDRVEDTPPNP